MWRWAMPCEEPNSSAAENMALSKGWRNHRLSLIGAKRRSTLGSMNEHLVAELNVLWKMHLPTPLPGASWPSLPLRGLEDCTCNN